MKTERPPISLEMLDFPTAWNIQKTRDLEHDLRCSAEQTDGGLLCDCGAIESEWHRLRAEAATS